MRQRGCYQMALFGASEDAASALLVDLHAMSRRFLVALSVVASVAAQKMELPDRERQVGVFDVRHLVEPGPWAAPGLPAVGRLGATQPSATSTLAAFLAEFALVDGKGAAVRAIGEEHVVALGSAPQIGTVEGMLVRLKDASDL
jgi:hypothetical protein